MKKDNVIKLIISIVLIVVIAYLSIFGLKIGDKTIIKSIKEIKTGLDISGGVTIVYQANADDGTEISQDWKLKISLII